MNDIYAYYQAIQDGSVLVGKWVRLWYKYIINGLENGSFFFAQKKAKAAVKFIEGFCRHHEGHLAPNLIRLELWQRALISVLFGVVDKTGARQFREAFIVMGRKNGKRSSRRLYPAIAPCWTVSTADGFTLRPRS